MTGSTGSAEARYAALLLLETQRELTREEKQQKTQVKYYLKKADERRAYSRSRYDPVENPKKAQEYRKANPEKVKESRKRHEEKYPDANRERAARRRKENPEKIKEINLRSRLKHRDKRNATTAAWRAANREHVQAYQIAYEERRKETRPARRRAQYAENPEPHRERSRAFAKAHPEYRRAAKMRRRAWKLAAGGTHTLAETQALFDKQGGLCANPFCQADLTVVAKHLDHIKPLSRGGSNAVANLQWLCQVCNQRKTNFDPEHWLEREAERVAELLDVTAAEARDVFVCLPAPTALECDEP